MTIFILIVEDRHCDDEIIPFKSEANAVAEAKARVAVELESRGQEKPDEEGLNESMRISGWVYYCRTFEDGVSVRVERKDVLP